MSNIHPYTPTVKSLSKIIGHLRSAPPKGAVSVETLKKLQMAPKNERSLIGILRFVGIIDDKGKLTKEANDVFVKHKDEDFHKSFDPLVKKSYSELFDLHGDRAWSLAKDELISFFRNHDKTGAAVGARQASTFMVLASLCGRREPLATAGDKSDKYNPKKAKSAKSETSTAKPQSSLSMSSDQNTGLAKDKTVGLAVKVEINLPAGETKETYDNIFKSIRENLIDV